MFDGKFITLAEFAYLTPIDLFHREEEKVELPPHPEQLKNLHVDFRGVFNLTAAQYEKSITLRFTADDYCKLYINGKFVARGPAQGYPWGYNFCEVDISEYITLGENEILAETYYCGLINRAYDSADLRFGFICDVISDGKTIASTDESWKCRVDNSYVGRRTTGYQTQYLEDRDLRIKPTEWERVRIKAHDYTFAKSAVPVLEVHRIEPIASVERLGSIIYDFGREVTGGLSLKVIGKSGDTIELRCAEELIHPENHEVTEGVLTPETEIRWKTRANCEYSETVILDDGENTIEQYDYKAFRYAEIILSEEVKVVDFAVTERHFPFDEEACTLSTSDKVLSEVFELCKLGVKLGSQECYVDCPGREKGQYAGDLTITSSSQLWLTGDPTLFLKSVRNQVESARIDEGLMAVTPGSYMQEIADYSLQFPILALRAYDVTGDKKQLAEHLEVCDRLLTYFEKYAREDGLLDGVTCKWNLVDWPTNLRDDYDFELTKPIGKGVHNVINAFYIGAVVLTERMIDLLEIKLEPGERRSDALIEAYNNCFYRPKLGLYADSESSDHCALHSNVLPLYFGFAKPECHAAALDLIRKRGFASGVYMAYFTLKALARLGCYSDIMKMLTSEGENSWYNMVREGNTCCIEAWGKDKKWNTSLCHPWASAPIPVLIEDILGITPRSPGYTDIDVRPHLPNSLAKFDMRIPLPDGRYIEFEWEKGFYNYRILK